MQKDFDIMDVNEEGKTLKEKVLDDDGKCKVQDSKWNDKKRANQRFFEIASDSIDTFTEHKLGTIDNCAHVVKFVNGRLYQTFFCKDRLCPLCQWRTSERNQGELSDVIDIVSRKKPEMRYIFLTLTVPDVEGKDLKRMIRALNQGFNRLFHYKAVKEVVEGYVKKIEVTVKRERVKTDEKGNILKMPKNMPVYTELEADGNNAMLLAFHPHIHVLIGVKPKYFRGENYLSQKEWTKLWERAMKKDKVERFKGVKHFIVNVQAVKNKRGKKNDENGVKEAVKETAKYALKSGDYLKSDEDDNFSDTYQTDKKVIKLLHKQLKNMRMLGYGGIFKDVYKKYKHDREMEREAEKQKILAADDDKVVGTMTAVWKPSYKKYYVTKKKDSTAKKIIHDEEKNKKRMKKAWQKDITVLVQDNAWDDDEK